MPPITDIWEGRFRDLQEAWIVSTGNDDTDSWLHPESHVSQSWAPFPILFPPVDRHFHIFWHSLSNHMATFTRKWNFHRVLRSTKLGCWWSFPPLPSYETLLPSQPWDINCSNLCLIKMTNDWRLAGGGGGVVTELWILTELVCECQGIVVNSSLSLSPFLPPCLSFFFTLSFCLLPSPHPQPNLKSLEIPEWADYKGTFVMGRHRRPGPVAKAGPLNIRHCWDGQPKSPVRRFRILQREEKSISWPAI